MKTTTLALALLISSIAGANAQSSPKPARLTWFQAMFDVNNNRVLDEEERQALKDALKIKREEFIAKWDTNGDGKVTGKELIKARKVIRIRIGAKRMAKFKEIAGEDNLISAEEFAAIPAFADRDPAKVARLFDFVDRDDSGDLRYGEFMLALRIRK